MLLLPSFAFWCVVGCCIWNSLLCFLFFLLKCDVILGPGYKLPKHFFDCSPIDIVEASAILVNVFNRKLLFDLCFLFLSHCSKFNNFLCWYLRKELFFRIVTGTDSLCSFSYCNKPYYKKCLVFNLLVFYLFIIYGFRMYSEIFWCLHQFIGMKL